MRRTIPFVLSLSLLLGGCLGSFTLTKKLYDFNRDVSDSYVVQEVVFLAFLIVPVYATSLFIDGVFLNLIEVITGDNPVADAPPETRLAELADGTTVAVIPGDDGEVHLELDRKGRRLYRKLGRRGGRLEIGDGERTLASLDIGSDGSAILTDAEGHRILLDAETVQRAAMAHASGGNEALVAEVSRVLAE